MRTATATRFRCTICHGRIPADKAVFSTHTRNRYCRDVTACARRAKRRAV